MVITREIKDEIKNAVSSALNSLLTEDFINKIAEKVTDSVLTSLNRKLSMLEQKVSDMDTRLNTIDSENSTVIHSLKSEIKELKKENVTVLKRYDYLEQETKMSNLRLFNLEESESGNTKNEVIKLLNSKMQLQLKENDISVCTRVGKNTANNEKPRGIFMKLSNPSIQQMIYKNKKLLKGTGVVMKEDLTIHRLNLMKKAIEKTSIRSVWTFSGNIYATKNNQKFSIKNECDLNKL
ncbi:unnamed protein product [Phaedon cochleariae]|uniref:Zinc finger DNA binding protein n=1 Tax=Phaedon cochleariae TaxID=80249 RepID=A0A9N9X500_PHACE|nr:unnamed protein product [Phaedon cochleariae]